MLSGVACTDCHRDKRVAAAICLRCRPGRDAGWLREFDRPRGIADFVIVEVYYMQSLAVFNFTFAKIVKIWLPLIVLLEIFGDVL